MDAQPLKHVNGKIQNGAAEDVMAIGERSPVLMLPFFVGLCIMDRKQNLSHCAWSCIRVIIQENAANCEIP